MFVDSMYQLGSKRSCIRELFEYGQQKARELGPEHVLTILSAIRPYRSLRRQER